MKFICYVDNFLEPNKSKKFEISPDILKNQVTTIKINVANEDELENAYKAFFKVPDNVDVAFPPCTHLSVSGARYFPEKRADGRQQQAIEFFMQCINANAPKIAVENPVGIMSTVYQKPTQIIQPWQFGENASKKTCLWLKGLPKLKPTNIIIKSRYANQTASGQNRLPPSPDRAKIRAITYQGIADAIAEQWSEII